ncbi:spore germination protein, partial [Priestia megaterium]|nr:spore germination protein [Priestia megaterium]
SHTANSKWVGACISMGNFSPSTSWMANGNFDPDFSDQDQIANPSMPISGQV